MSKVKENNDNATSNEIINDNNQYKVKLKLIKSLNLDENYVKLFQTFLQVDLFIFLLIIKLKYLILI